MELLEETTAVAFNLEINLLENMKTRRHALDWQIKKSTYSAPSNGDNVPHDARLKAAS
jgi:hypothetical protein